MFSKVSAAWLYFSKSIRPSRRGEIAPARKFVIMLIFLPCLQPNICEIVCLWLLWEPFHTVNSLASFNLCSYNANICCAMELLPVIAYPTSDARRCAIVLESKASYCSVSSSLQCKQCCKCLRCLEPFCLQL